MAGMTDESGQVPRGLRLTIVVLTVVAAVVAIAAATRGTWAVTVIAGLMAVGNLVLLLSTRGSRAGRTS